MCFSKTLETGFESVVLIFVSTIKNFTLKKSFEAKWVVIKLLIVDWGEHEA